MPRILPVLQVVRTCSTPGCTAPGDPARVTYGLQRANPKPSILNALSSQKPVPMTTSFTLTPTTRSADSSHANATISKRIVTIHDDRPFVPSKVSIRTKMVTPNNWFVSCSRPACETWFGVPVFYAMFTRRNHDGMNENTIPTVTVTKRCSLQLFY